MKTCLSEGKLMKQFRNPLFPSGPPLLSTNPPVSEQFFLALLFVQISKTRNNPLILWGGGGGTMDMWTNLYLNLSQIVTKPITHDVCIKNGYIVEFGKFPKECLINGHNC